MRLRRISHNIAGFVDQKKSLRFGAFAEYLSDSLLMISDPIVWPKIGLIAITYVPPDHLLILDPQNTIKIFDRNVGCIAVNIEWQNFMAMDDNDKRAYLMSSIVKTVACFSVSESVKIADAIPKLIESDYYRKYGDIWKQKKPMKWAWIERQAGFDTEKFRLAVRDRAKNIQYFDVYQGIIEFGVEIPGFHWSDFPVFKFEGWENDTLAFSYKGVHYRYQDGNLSVT